MFVIALCSTRKLTNRSYMFIWGRWQTTGLGVSTALTVTPTAPSGYPHTVISARGWLQFSVTWKHPLKVFNGSWYSSVNIELRIVFFSLKLNLVASISCLLLFPISGGRTVFPWVGAGVNGKPGAAMVWWNLLSSHEHDFLTRHAACPVMRGRKTGE